AEAAGISAATWRQMLDRYRWGAVVLGLPLLRQAAGEGERGLKSLPNVRELIARSESPDLDPSAATAEERVKAIAPFVHGDMTVYSRSGTKHRESWGERQWLSADRTLAAA